MLVFGVVVSSCSYAVWFSACFRHRQFGIEIALLVLFACLCAFRLQMKPLFALASVACVHAPSCDEECSCQRDQYARQNAGARYCFFCVWLSWLFNPPRIAKVPSRLFAAAPVSAIDTEKLVHVFGGFVFDLVCEFASSVIAILPCAYLASFILHPTVWLPR